MYNNKKINKCKWISELIFLIKFFFVCKIVNKKIIVFVIFQKKLISAIDKTYLKESLKSNEKKIKH